jgi:hypothetical protein
MVKSDKVLLFYFKPIQTKDISGILKKGFTLLKTMLGVHFIKRDGVGSTMTLMK